MNPNIKVPYGEANFRAIREQNYLYVDKTKFIEKIEQTKRIIHLRPRRFGKSLFLSMLNSYYDIKQADDFDNLFKGLYIHEHPTPDKNNYYILRFNFSGIETKSYEAIMEGFLNKVRISISEFISYYQLPIEISEQNSPSIILSNLLSDFGKLNLNQKIYILIDEYDHFTNAVLNNGLTNFTELVRRGGTVRSFYEVIKENTELGIIDRFFITGVMSVSLDSMTSGFNIGSNLTTKGTVAEIMGFNSSEVKDLLRTCGFTEKLQAQIFEVLKENYNGYLFSKSSTKKVFNSTLIMYYLKAYQLEGIPPESLIDPNLNQSGATIETLVNLANADQNYDIIEKIVQEKQVPGTLSSFIDVGKKYDTDDFITLMFNIGLLTIKESGFETIFEMPNKIIETVYFQYLQDMLKAKYDYSINTNLQSQALRALGIDGNIQPITHLVTDFLQHLSTRNTIDFDEKYIKFVYMMLLSATHQYIVRDEEQAKQGYTDLTILKSPESYAQYEYLIELKHIKKSLATSAKVESVLVDGIEQIRYYLTDKRLAQRNNLKKFVIVFAGFEVACLEEVQ